MAGRPLGRKNIRSYMAAEDLDRLGINPIEEAIKAAKELEEMKIKALEAFDKHRGNNPEGGDAGTQYLASAIKCITEKAAIFVTMAKFKHPTLSAVAVRDVTDINESKEPMTTAQAIDIIKSDFFSPDYVKSISTEQVIEAINTNNDNMELPIGTTNNSTK